MTANANANNATADAAFNALMNAGSVEGKLGAVAAFLTQALNTLDEAITRNTLEGPELDKIQALVAAIDDVKATTQDIRAEWTETSANLTRVVAYTKAAKND